LRECLAAKMCVLVHSFKILLRNASQTFLLTYSLRRFPLNGHLNEKQSEPRSIEIFPFALCTSLLIFFSLFISQFLSAVKKKASIKKLCNAMGRERAKTVRKNCSDWKTKKCFENFKNAIFLASEFMCSVQ
jgi:hypothetical protein